MRLLKDYGVVDTDYYPREVVTLVSSAERVKVRNAGL